MEQPSPIGKKLRMIHNKFREVADRNLQKYNLTAAQLEISVNPRGEITVFTLSHLTL